MDLTRTLTLTLAQDLFVAVRVYHVEELRLAFGLRLDGHDPTWRELG